ncbi:MAG: tetratricopeptide repeat protein [Myxococcaceae bacterium]
MNSGWSSRVSDKMRGSLVSWWPLLTGSAVLLPFIVLQLACDSPQGHLERARVARHQGAFQVALAEYRTALNGLEGDASGRAEVIRARALREAGDVYYLDVQSPPDAIVVYRELIRVCPEAPETLDARIHLADILEYHYRDFRGTIVELSAAIARNPPESAELAYRIARLYFELGDYSQAQLEAANVATRYEMSTYVDDALLLRAQALEMLDGQRPEALRILSELAERFPSSELTSHALFEKCNLLADEGRYDSAIEACIKALPTHPKPELVESTIARLHSQIRRMSPDGVGDAARAFDRDNAGVAGGR